MKNAIVINYKLLLDVAIELEYILFFLFCAIFHVWANGSCALKYCVLFNFHAKKGMMLGVQYITPPKYQFAPSVNNFVHSCLAMLEVNMCHDDRWN